MTSSNSGHLNHQISTPPSSSESDMSSSSDDPHPHFYIQRDTGELVPLIAVDEIHPMFHIHGVPRSVDAETLEDWDMARCGNQVAHHKKYYRIEIIARETNESAGHTTSSSDVEEEVYSSVQMNGPYVRPSLPYKGEIPRQYQGDEAISSHVMQNAANSPFAQHDGQISKEEVIRQAQLAAADPREYAQNYVNHMFHKHNLVKGRHPSKTKDAATPGSIERKIYCAHWIRNGECDFMQQGCKYLHVIPDEATLLSIGIRGIPRWVKEQMPAPRHDVFPKHRPAVSRDWRRRASRAGQLNEQATTPHHQARTTLSPSTTINHPSAPATQHSNVPSLLFSPPAQHFPTHANHMAQQHPLMSPFISKPKAVPTPFRSTTSAAAASYQRQIQAHSGAAQPIPPTPTSAVHRYSPPTQPPISRPVKSEFRAADKGSAGTPGQNRIQPAAQPASGTLFGKSHNGSSVVNGKQDTQILGSLENRPTLSALTSASTGMSMDTRANTPAINGTINSTPTDTSTPSAQAPTTSQIQATAVDQNGQSQRQINHVMPTYHAKLQRIPSSSGGSSGTIHTTSSTHDVATRMVNHHLTGSVNGTANGKAATTSNGQPGSASNGQINANFSQPGASPSSATDFKTPPVVMHRRHFVAPGEPEYVATTVEVVEQAPVKKSGSGGQRKRHRGRGSNQADLIET